MPATKDHIFYDLFIWKSRIEKFIDTYSKLLVCLVRDGGEMEEVGGGMISWKVYISFGDEENVLKVTLLMIALICKYTKIHCIVHFKRVNYMICERHHRIAKKENSVIYILSYIL